MSYIGRTPQIGAYSKLDAITTDGSASYTMQLNSANFVPESVNHLIVSVNGVIQAPTDSFTVSGSTITFASSLSASDTIDFIMALGNVLDIGVPSDNTVSLSKLTASGTKDATTFLRGDNTFSPAGGITEADQWRVNTNFSNSSNRVDEDITSNWERADTTDFEKIGTGLTESSGIFSFPSTGKYFISAHSWFYQTSATSGGHFKLFVTTDNSTYNERAQSIGGGDSDRPVSLKFNSIIDCTDTSNVKFKFVTNGGTYITWQCSTNSQKTGFNIIRLGDT